MVDINKLMNIIIIFLGIALISFIIYGIKSIVTFNKSKVEPVEEISEYDRVKQLYENENNILKCRIDSLNDVIVKMSVVIDSVSEIKSKIHVVYEYKYKDYSNISIVSNDSITKYISSRLSEE